MGLSLRSPNGNATPLPGAIVYDVLVAQLTASVNNFNPPGADIASVFALNATAAFNLTGMAGGVNGVERTLVNTGANPITLTQEDAGSSAVNRFSFTIALAQNQAVKIQWSSLIQRWISVGGGGGGGSVETVAGFSIPAANLFTELATLNPGGLINCTLSFITLAQATTTLLFHGAVTGSTGTGAIQVPNPASADLLDVVPLIRNTSAAAVNSSGAQFNSNATYVVFRECSGNPRAGGFLAYFRFGWPIARADQRVAAGLFNSVSTLTITVDPSTLLNFVGICKDEADANLQLMHNDGAGAATKIDLGVSFVSRANALLDLFIGCPAGGGNVFVSLFDRQNDVILADNVELTTNLPAIDAILNPHVQANTGATTGTAVAVEMNRMLWMRPF